ncbi:MAG TPA: transposase [Pyrinomonadaceae bacterium]|nr:transposase [Pyrinomonadaceae bacterium]
MNRDKYVGMDVDQATCVIAVEDQEGKFVMEACVPTRASDLRAFFKGLDGRINVAFEEGTQAAWLFELIEPLVKEVVVCDRRGEKARGNKGDRVDAQKLARELRLGNLRRVYQGERGYRELKELIRGYDYIVQDIVRTKCRLKAAFRSRGVKCGGPAVYGKNREDWLTKIDVDALRARVSSLYEQLDCLTKLRERAEKAMIDGAKKHQSYKLLIRQPGLGPIRSAQILGVVGTPERFRTKRQFWPYCGLGVVVHESSEYEIVNGQRRRRKRPVRTRGLNKNFNRTLKVVFKGAAKTAIAKDPFKQYYQRLIDKKIRPEMAKLTVARKISAITLAILKSGKEFDPIRVNQAVPDSGEQRLG